MENDTIFNKIAEHNLAQTRRKKRRRNKVKKLWDAKHSVKYIVSKVDASKSTVESDLRAMGYNIKKDNSLSLALMIKWFKQGYSFEKIGNDLCCSADEVERVITEYIFERDAKK